MKSIVLTKHELMDSSNGICRPTKHGTIESFVGGWAMESATVQWIPSLQWKLPNMPLMFTRRIQHHQISLRIKTCGDALCCKRAFLYCIRTDNLIDHKTFTQHCLKLKIIWNLIVGWTFFLATSQHALPQPISYHRLTILVANSESEYYTFFIWVEVGRGCGKSVHMADWVLGEWDFVNAK